VLIISLVKSASPVVVTVATNAPEEGLAIGVQVIVAIP
jgi:hypothetical protein